MKRLGCILAFVSAAQALTCHQCTHTRDALNETYGVGNPDCWDQDEVNDPATCTGEEICLTRILAQWNGLGHQVYQLSRGCGTPPDLHCQSTTIAGMQVAECHEQCQENNCNGKESVISTSYMFNHGDSVETCEACQHYENTNGDVDGNMNCKDQSSDNAAGCPGYANKACYTATSISYDGNDVQQTNTDRGCSSFIINTDDSTECTLSNSNGKPVDTCKQTCMGDDCNTKQPDYEIDTTPTRSCLSCAVTVDQNNQTVGAGDASCWLGDSKLSVVCEENEICKTEMEVDWLAKGAIQYTVKRGCTNSAIQESPCITGETSLIKYLDCSVQCDPLATQPNCNTGLDAIGDKIYDPSQSVDHCYTCSYEQDNYGNVNGLPTCGEPIEEGNVNMIPTPSCPKYSSKTCFEASSTHLDYNAETKQIDEDYRGCSPFGPQGSCISMEMNGYEHTNCKNACRENLCNIDTHQTQRRCYSCTGTQDHSGASAGISDDRCWDPLLLEDSMLTSCAVDEPYCMDTLSVDWFANGAQVSFIQRGCSKTEAPETCQETSSGSIYDFIDCGASCMADEKGGCNSDLTVADKLQGDQKECSQCYDRVHGDGSVEGNENCPNTPTKSVECPPWASQACFTSSGTHYVNGENRMDVYRGCSAFQLANHNNGYGPEGCYGGMMPDIDGVQQQFNTCKLTCSGDSCNNEEAANPNVDTGVPLCQVCTVTVDQANNTVGNGDDACWLGDNKYLQACPNPTDMCITEMLSDWYPRGMIQYMIKRGCAEKVQDKCLSATSSLLSYKDCQVGCSPAGNSGCNTGLDEVAAKFGEGAQNVGSCITCQYYQNDDGNVLGNPDCDEYPEQTASLACPVYARNACMEAASFHSSYSMGSNVEIKDDFRGCSPFAMEGEYVCQTANTNSIAHRNCKNTCSEDNCNIGPLSRGHSCYSCSATRNSNGDSVGTSDDRCFDGVYDIQDLVMDCPDGHDYCNDELLIDWTPRGDQLATIRRGCSSQKPLDSCTENSGQALFKYKDCFHYCEENACNNDMTVANEFVPNKQNNITSVCYSCQYVESDSGEIEEGSNLKCKEKLSSDSDLQKTCAMYQLNSCFTAATYHIAGSDSGNAGEKITQVYKGCSSFVLSTGFEFDNTILPGPSGEETGYTLSRTTCGFDQCNEEHYELDAMVEIVTCQQCQATVDMFNRTIGVGDSGCWSGASQYNRECPAGYPYCATELLSDWLTKGEIQYIVKRGCSIHAPNEIMPCEEATSTMIQYKDCQVTCDPSTDGPGCNVGLDSVAARFSSPNPVNTCYQCYYKQQASGSIAGFPECNGDPKTNGLEPTQCPAYANTACYYASSTHLNYNSVVDSFEDDYRGCSPFASDHYNETFHCELVNANGIRHETCKGSCDGTETCNDQPMEPPKNMCVTCSVTMDSDMNPVFGRRGCWNANPSNTDYFADCHNDEPYCVDEIQVDWHAYGYQYTTLNRGCSATPPPEECHFDESARLKIKDCYQSCEGSVCNTNLTEVTSKFIDESYVQNSCYTCMYFEAEDGSILGNEYCRDLDQAPPEANVNLLIVDCPEHASVGCYTGAALHDVDGQDKEEVYKGCSSFIISEDPFYELTNEFLPNNMTYNLAKETCRGASCNYKTLHPWPSGEEGPSSSTDKPTTTPADARYHGVSIFILIISLYFL